jgi:hypothetical protein
LDSEDDDLSLDDNVDLNEDSEDEISLPVDETLSLNLDDDDEDLTFDLGEDSEEKK